MFWIKRSWLQIVFSLSLFLICPSLQADEANPGMEAWLITYGPGEISWERFGHNAIWIRDKDLGLDHVFNFGFFDFNQKSFYTRFLQGKLWYFSAAELAEREFSRYINENRSIRAQKLNLSAEQSLRLAEYLLHEIQPENRDYLYDYYTNNCSTRIRDALDLALGGVLATRFDSVTAEQSWRDHTRRLTIGDYWTYLGLEIGLGSKVDQLISQWDEFFIPAELAEAVAELSVPGAGSEQPFVLEDIMIFESSLEPAPVRPASWWPRYLLLSAVVLACAWLTLVVPALTPIRLVRAWLVLAGGAGSALVFFWFFTDHEAARLNLNLLVLNPLWWFFAAWRQHKAAGILLLLLSFMAVIMLILPPGQYNLDVLAAFLPLNIVSGFVLYRSGGRAQAPISASKSA